MPAWCNMLFQIGTTSGGYGRMMFMKCLHPFGACDIMASYVMTFNNYVVGASFLSKTRLKGNFNFLLMRFWRVSYPVCVWVNLKALVVVSLRAAPSSPIRLIGLVVRCSSSHRSGLVSDRFQLGFNFTVFFFLVLNSHHCSFCFVCIATCLYSDSHAPGTSTHTHLARLVGLEEGKLHFTWNYLIYYLLNNNIVFVVGYHVIQQLYTPHEWFMNWECLPPPRLAYTLL